MKLVAIVALIAIHAAEAQEVRASFNTVSFQNDALKSQVGYSASVVLARRDGRAWRFGYTASERSRGLRTSICSGFCNPQFQIVESVHRRASAQELSAARDFRIFESRDTRVASSIVVGGHLARVSDHWRGDSTGFTHKYLQFAIGPSVGLDVVARATPRFGIFAAIAGASYIGPHIAAEDSFDPFGYGFTAARGSIGLALSIGPSGPK